MAKEYQSPSKRKEEEDEDQRKEDLRRQQQQAQGTGPQPEQDNETQQKMQDEMRQQSEKAGKERQSYLDEMNKKIGEVVNFAGQQKDKNPQFLNLTSEALKNAADQIDAATPQGVARNTSPQGNPQPSMR